MSQEQIETDLESVDGELAEDEVEAEKMPLIQHLVELRNRLLWSIGALVIGFVLCYVVAEEIYEFLVQPLADVMEGEEGRRLIYTGLHEAFFTYLKVAFFGSVCMTFPIVAGQIWAFAGFIQA